MNLLNFRSAFLDSQNKAEFRKAGLRLVHEFRNFQMYEKSKNQNDEDFMKIFASKFYTIIVWKIDKKSYVLRFQKDSYNVLTFEDYPNPDKVFHGQKASIYDREIIITLHNKITDLYTGKNWGELENI